jgi:hypothetical protein
MGNRFIESKLETTGKNITSTWGRKAHNGKYWKRRLHKAERKLVRETGGKERSVLHYLSFVDWKGW